MKIRGEYCGRSFNCRSHVEEDRLPVFDERPCNDSDLALSFDICHFTVRSRRLSLFNRLGENCAAANSSKVALLIQKREVSTRGLI